MPSLGYLLLFSLAVVLISPTSGYYRKPRCPQAVSQCQNLKPCRGDSECGMGQSCCDSGCGFRCFSGISDFFRRIFSCNGCGCSGSSCGGGCSSRCGQSSGYQGGYGGYRGNGGYGGYGGYGGLGGLGGLGGGFFGKKK